ncbi:uncharacterized protein EI90DRAFT_3036720 [Cantharellus anzutake]|uniref:uncharacterized protein n=1 Tax=Cantharellus anzutake TaxID=1750568 RepID=UPI00190384EB|nr:uncharacterized protein EI90DRAFT_3036720 [Cantharellus anzutake]KAF8340744.1 hypothetical protein EI90DRAFT_3036720 [Cantharellus anzutake]
MRVFVFASLIGCFMVFPVMATSFNVGDILNSGLTEKHHEEITHERRDGGTQGLGSFGDWDSGSPVSFTTRSLLDELINKISSKRDEEVPAADIGADAEEAELLRRALLSKDRPLAKLVLARKVADKQGRGSGKSWSRRSPQSQLPKFRIGLAGAGYFAPASRINRRASETNHGLADIIKAMSVRRSHLTYDPLVYATGNYKNLNLI